MAALCRATRAARSSYYEWRKRSEGPSAALVDEAYMANRVYDVWKRSRGRYGSPRVTAALAQSGGGGQREAGGPLDGRAGHHRPVRAAQDTNYVARPASKRRSTWCCATSPLLRRMKSG